MQHYFYDLLGNSAIISEKEDQVRLVIKDAAGKIKKDQTYTTFHGAKTALGRASIWIPGTR